MDQNHLCTFDNYSLINFISRTFDRRVAGHFSKFRKKQSTLTSKTFQDCSILTQYNKIPIQQNNKLRQLSTFTLSQLTIIEQVSMRFFHSKMNIFGAMMSHCCTYKLIDFSLDKHFVPSCRPTQETQVPVVKRNFLRFS